MAWQPQGGVLMLGEELVGVSPVMNQDGKRIGTAILGMTPRTLWAVWVGVAVVTSIAFLMVLIVFGFFLLPIARRALVPVTRLEAQIRKRDVKDKSKLADSSDDQMLKPLLTAIDEVHERSEAQMRRALALAYADPVTRLPNRLRFMSKLEMLVDKGQGPGSCYLAVCDINAFRKLNVAHGPRIADMILSAVAERLRALASQSKGLQLFIGRIGADQFGIIAPGAEQDALNGFLEEAERAIAEPMHHGVVRRRHCAARCCDRRRPFETGRDRPQGSQAPARRAPRFLRRPHPAESHRPAAPGKRDPRGP
jgi:diguanylate cyclase (GGDEF)-like protein